jgi:hypothetical protein
MDGNLNSFFFSFCYSYSYSFFGKNMMAEKLSPGRRSIKSKRIRVACTVQFSNGLICQGFTQSISMFGVFVEPQDMSFGGNNENAPKVGDLAILKLRCKDNDERKVITTRCRMMQVLQSGINIQVNFYQLTAGKLALLNELLTT